MRIAKIYCTPVSESITSAKYNIVNIIPVNMNLTKLLLKSSTSCDDDENQTHLNSTTSTQQQRHQIIKSKVRFKCRSAYHPQYSLSHRSADDDDYDTEKSCDKIIILSKTRRKPSTMTSSMCWKNILVFSVIVLIYLTSKDCIAAARQLEGMFTFTFSSMFNCIHH